MRPRSRTADEHMKTSIIKKFRSAASNIFHLASDRRFREYHRQRRVTDINEREGIADRFAATLPCSRADDLASHSEAITKLRDDGIVFLDGVISDAQLIDIRKYFAKLPAHDPYRPDQGKFLAPDEVPVQTHVSHYSYDQILAAPHLMDIANDPRILLAVEGVLGAKPTLAAIRVWWSTPTQDGEPEHAELFHRDVDDLRFVKLFVYLTDVDVNTGPHIFVSGSHRQNRLMAISRYKDSEVEQAFGSANILTLTGKAGTAFLENTFGMHRGMPPRQGPRLIFQPLYTLRPVIFGPRKPIGHLEDFSGSFDPYVNRVFLR
jgi:Phytanoyl-CoA dioxygenase (PhyH)